MRQQASGADESLSTKHDTSDFNPVKGGGVLKSITGSKEL
jgi:hypothetical protein